MDIFLTIIPIHLFPSLLTGDCVSVKRDDIVGTPAGMT